MSVPAAERERLAFLTRVVDKEVQHLSITHRRFFARPITEERLQKLEEDIPAAEQLDAFVSRFARLQDTLGDKLLPSLLRVVGESVGPVIDNLDRAERFGWLDSADEWLLIRQLRNKMIHEYIEDPSILRDALDRADKFVPRLQQAAAQMLREIRQRKLAGV